MASKRKWWDERCEQLKQLTWQILMPLTLENWRKYCCCNLSHYKSWWYYHHQSWKRGFSWLYISRVAVNMMPKYQGLKWKLACPRLCSATKWEVYRLPALQSNNAVNKWGGGLIQSLKKGLGCATWFTVSTNFPSKNSIVRLLFEVWYWLNMTLFISVFGLKQLLSIVSCPSHLSVTLLMTVYVLYGFVKTTLWK